MKTLSVNKIIKIRRANKIRTTAADIAEITAKKQHRHVLPAVKCRFAQSIGIRPDNLFVIADFYNKKAKNWEYRYSTTKSWCYSTGTDGRYKGAYSMYTVPVHYLLYPSQVIISQDKKSIKYLRLGDTSIKQKITVPKKWEFVIKKSLCIQMVKNPDCDYHFTHADFKKLADKSMSISDFLALAVNNFEYRQKKEQEEKEKHLREEIDAQKELDEMFTNHPWVTVAGSLSARNCAAGTETFRQTVLTRLNIPAFYHSEIDTLPSKIIWQIAQTTGEINRVKAAILHS